MAGSHIDTPAWQSFETRMRARAAERRAARRRRRIRNATMTAAALVVFALAFVAIRFGLQSRTRAPEIATAEVTVLPPPPAPPRANAPPAVQPLPLPANWDVAETAAGAETLEGAETADTLAGAETLAGAVAPGEAETLRQAETFGQPATTLSRAKTPVRTREATMRPLTREPDVTAAAPPQPRILPPPPPERAVAAAPAPAPRQQREPIGTTGFGSPRVAPVESPAATRPAAIEPPPSAAAESIPSSGDSLPSAGASVPPPAAPVERRETAPAATTVDSRVAVRGAIERYRSAYERLDAAAARAVWPGVDEDALARAFESLESQQVSFEDCAIDVAGSVADATCRGRARIVPKIGGGTESVSRTWTFSLRQSGDGWIIERASVRQD